MSKTRSIGTALSLALCSAALAGCNYSNQGSNQNETTSNASTSDIDGTWKSDTEKQLRDAIAGAPANGLRPELFLKGGETGPALTQAALKYASALANGYSDPTKLHEVYTIPYKPVDVRRGLQQALQKGDVKSWLELAGPANRRVSRAEPGSPALPGSRQDAVPAGVGREADQAGLSRPARAQVAAALRAVGYLGPAGPQVQPDSLAAGRWKRRRRTAPLRPFIRPSSSPR